MRGLRTVVGLALACLVMVPSVALAQASIAGMVKDTSGAVLPGVTVEATSPALIEKVRSAATDGGGQYRIENLRPGVYTVTFTLTGFATVKREGIELGGTFTATVNAELRVGAVEETVTVTGDYAYGLLVSEIGVHRLVRISPYDFNKRRHTSFASVFVLPEIDDKIDIQVREEDLRVDTYRSAGAGGQHVNTTDSAVRITHLPSGIVVACQNERSQHKNRAVAMKVLRARLYEAELEKKREESRKTEKSKLDIDFGSQIRSYVLHPYQMVKDVRTRVEVGDVNRVLDGDLDVFIHGYLLSKRAEVATPKA